MIRHQLKAVFVEDLPPALAAAAVTFALVCCATARGAEDPPRLTPTDPPRIERRVGDLERRVSDLEAALAKGTKAAPCPCAGACDCPAGACPAGCPASPADRFTATDGVTYARGADGHYRAVSAPAAVQDSAPRPVTVGAAPRVYSLPQASGGCPNGNCSAEFRPRSRYTVPR